VDIYNYSFIYLESAPITQQNSTKEMSFIEHLEELRWHLIRSLSAITIITIIVFLLKDLVFGKIILGPSKASFFTYQTLCDVGKKLRLGEFFCFDKLTFEIINTEMAGQFLIHLKSSFILGFIVAFPYVLYEVWKFIKPGLYESERRYTSGIVAFGSFFFFMGVLFGYFVLTPFSINFLGSYFVSETVENTITLSSYVSTLTTLVVASGAVFELPMIVFILAKLQLITANDMRTYRKHGLVIMLIFSAIITPPDLTSQIIIALPLYVLYEFSILIAKRVNPTPKSEEVSSA